MKKILCMFAIFVCSISAFAYDSGEDGVVVSLGEFVITNVVDTKYGKKYILNNREAIAAITCNDVFSSAHILVVEGLTKTKLRMRKSDDKGVIFYITVNDNVVIADEFQFSKKSLTDIF